MDLEHLRDGTATLLCDGREVAPVQIAASCRARYRGFLGRDSTQAALLLLRTNGVHTLGMRFAIDVAYLSKDLRVITVLHLKPNRWSRNRVKARHTLEAEAGSFKRWGICKFAYLGLQMQ